MKCHIFTGPHNYNILQLFVKEEGDYVIGADQGALYLAQAKIRFDLALGDFDSVLPEDMALIQSYAKKVSRFPIKKDFTDTHLAIKEAKSRGYNEIIIYGGIGKRFDHTLANLYLLKMGNITILTNMLKMYMYKPGTYTIKNKHQYISFFALEDVKNLTLKGFLYELDNVSLSVGNPLCISNQGHGKVSFSEGELLVIHQNE